MIAPLTCCPSPTSATQTFGATSQLTMSLPVSTLAASGSCGPAFPPAAGSDRPGAGRHGAEVVGTARDLARTRKALRAARRASAGGGSIDVIETGGPRWPAFGPQPGKLVADRPFGLVITPMPASWRDAYCRQVQTVRHQPPGHFVLVNRIAPADPQRQPVREPTSAGHRFPTSSSTIRTSSARRTAFAAYGRSKTANVLFAVNSTAVTRTGESAPLRSTPAAS